MTPIGNSSFAPTALSYIGEGNYEVSSDGGQTKSVINEQAAKAVGLSTSDFLEGESSPKKDFDYQPEDIEKMMFKNLLKILFLSHAVEV